VLSGSLDDWGGPVIALFEKPVASVTTPFPPVGGDIRKPRSSSSGPRIMTTARARAASCRAIRRGWSTGLSGAAPGWNATGCRSGRSGGEEFGVTEDQVAAARHRLHRRSRSES
jgi:hypothetical protein